MRLVFLLFLWMSFAASAVAEIGDSPRYKLRLTSEALVFVALQFTPESNIHRLGGQIENTVYLSQDGHREMVVNGKGETVEDCLNNGSFNFAHPMNEPVRHFATDILPWLKWGNCDPAKSTADERVAAWSKDFEVGLRKALSNRTKLKTFRKVKPRNLRNQKTLVALTEAVFFDPGISSKLLDKAVKISDQEIELIVSKVAAHLAAVLAGE